MTHLVAVTTEAGCASWQPMAAVSARGRRQHSHSSAPGPSWRKLTELGYPQAMVAIDLAAALGVETGDPRTEQEPELALLVELVGVVTTG